MLSPAERILHPIARLGIFCLLLTTIIPIISADSGSASPAQTASQQSSPSVSSSSTAQTAPEMTSHEAPTTFQVNVRLVQVHVVVRDLRGNAIGNLHREDFRLLDNGKPQVITKFNVEQPGEQIAREATASQSSPDSGATPAPPAHIPERYVAYVFDDVHVATGDLLAVRQATGRSIDSLQATDRAAIYTTSGQGEVDFTDDHAKLRDAVNKLSPRPFGSASVNECPRMTYYLADQIQNKDDDRALAAVTADALECAFGNDGKFAQMARQMAVSTAARELNIGDAETRLALTSLKDVVRRLAAVPGERVLVLVSPGFITPHYEYEVDEIIDRAVRENTVVNALDARGLYTIIPNGDASEKGVKNTIAAGIEALYQTAGASADSDVMGELADATGGAFFHNNNDFDEGFRRVASAPEYHYVLGFSPQNLKTNGSYHKIKVTLNTTEKYSIQARRGYFAPKQPPGSEQDAKQDIEDAVFSQEEMHELPIDLHTQFFKPTESDAKLTVLAHVDVKQLHFRKAEGRNNDDLTIVSVIFDRNGNYVTGIEKTLQLHLRDDTLANKLGSGLSVKSNFDLKPGDYLVRLVVRDAGGSMCAENGAVQIP